MSKVVHLSDDAHASAKKHCQQAGMKMSEWVAALIASATKPPIAPTKPAPAPAARPVALRAAALQETTVQPASHPARKAVAPLALEAPSGEEADFMLYAAPPFWARSGAGRAASHAAK